MTRQIKGAEQLPFLFHVLSIVVAANSSRAGRTGWTGLGPEGGWKRDKTGRILVSIKVLISFSNRDFLPAA